MSLYSKIVNHTGIYLVGSILQRSVGFVMLPIYTHYLSPADYGVIELLTLSIDFVGLVFGLRVSQSIFKYHSEYSGKERDEVVTSALYLVACLGLIGVSLVYLFSKNISVITFGDESQAANLVLLSLTLLGQGFVSVPMTSMKAAQKPVLFVSVSMLRLLLQLTLNIYFVVTLEMGVQGVIYSSVIATMIMSISLTTYVVLVRGIGFSLIKAKQLATFSFPLLLSDVFAFYLTFGDRYFIRLYHGMSAVGIYSLGYKFGILLPFLVVTPFSGIWNTEKYTIAKSENPQNIYSKIFIFFSLALILVAVLIALFAKDLIRVMADEQFAEAYIVVPIILSAYVLQAWTSYTNLGIYLENRTIEIFYGTVLAVIVITVGYLVLIPVYSGVGAAFATFFAYLVRLVWINVRSRKLYDMGVRWRDALSISLCSVITIYLGSLSPENIIASIIYNLTIFTIFSLVLYFSPFLSPEIKSSIKQKIYSISIFNLGGARV